MVASWPQFCFTAPFDGVQSPGPERESVSGNRIDLFTS